MHAKPQLSALLSMKEKEFESTATGLHKSQLHTNRSNLPSLKKKNKQTTVILSGCVFLGQADVTQQITRSKAAVGSDDFSLGRLSQ